MTFTEQEKYRVLAALTEGNSCPEGYIYVGKGADVGKLPFGENLLLKVRGDWFANGRENSGTSGGDDYACPLAIWEEKTGLKYKDVLNVSSPTKVLPKCFAIEVPNEHTSRFVQEEFFARGISWRGGQEEYLPGYTQGFICFCVSEGKISFGSFEPPQVISLSEFLEKELPSPAKVFKINNEYSAELQGDKILIKGKDNLSFDKKSLNEVCEIIRKTDWEGVFKNALVEYKFHPRFKAIILPEGKVVAGCQTLTHAQVLEMEKNLLTNH